MVTDSRRQGEFIRARRIAASRTQKWLAEASMVSERTIIRAEKGEGAGLSAENLLSVCSALGIDVSEVPRGRAEEPRSTGGVAEDWRRLGQDAMRVLRFVYGLSPWAHAAAAFATILVFTTTVALVDARQRMHRFEPYSFVSDLAAARILGGIVDEVDRGLATASVGAVDRIVENASQAIVPDCDGVAWYRWIAPGAGCDYDWVETVRMEARPGLVRLKIGPMTQRSFKATMALLPRTLATTVAVSIVPGNVEAVPDAALAFDPRGVDPETLPHYRDGDGFVLELDRRQGA